MAVQVVFRGKDDLSAFVALTVLIIRVQFSPSLVHVIRKLIEEEGAVKVRSIVQATSLPQHILDLTHQYAGLCAAFRSSGSDA
jgi:hypothetical protein